MTLHVKHINHGAHHSKLVKYRGRRICANPHCHRKIDLIPANMKQKDARYCIACRWMSAPAMTDYASIAPLLRIPRRNGIFDCALWDAQEAAKPRYRQVKTMSYG